MKRNTQIITTYNPVDSTYDVCEITRTKVQSVFSDGRHTIATIENEDGKTALFFNSRFARYETVNTKYTPKNAKLSYVENHAELLGELLGDNDDTDAIISNLIETYKQFFPTEGNPEVDQ